MKNAVDKTPVRILYLENAAPQQQLVKERLSADRLNCEFVHVEVCDQFENALRRTQFDLIFSGFDLGSSSSMAALAAARKAQPDTPFIFVGGAVGEERAVEALRMGATDIVFKNQLDRLGAVVARALREAWLARERKRVQQLGRIQASALEAAANGILITDREGSILSANPAVCAMTGYEKGELIGQTPRLLKSGKHDTSFYHDLWATIRAGRVWRGEVTNRRKDGKRYVEEMTITPVQASDGKITHFIAVKADITEKKQLEEQLRQARKLEAIGQLAGGIAHDFNNMLAVITGNVQLLSLMADEYRPEARECLKQITVASERAANLTRQLLAFGRKQAMEPKPLNLNQVIENLVKMLRRVIGEHIGLKCSCNEHLPFVHADVGMLEQVLMNLTLNARDAMPNGGELLITTQAVTVDEAYARSQPEAREGDFVCLSVSDTGSGIAPEQLPHIFEPFYTTKEPGKGTGLGLATVYGLVKQHQGWIEVTTGLGKGATFKTFLPAIAPSQEEAKTQPETTVRGGTENILLVEDEEAVRLLTRRLLEANGYRVWEAVSGKEALNVWENLKVKIHLLLTDIIMPDGVTGRELAEQLCAQAPALKVIFTSGYNLEVAGKDTEFLRRSRKVFLQKPCRADHLLETVRHCLDGVLDLPEADRGSSVSKEVSTDHQK